MAGRTRTVRWAAPAIATALLLAACGDDADEASDRTSGMPTAAAIVDPATGPMTTAPEAETGSRTNTALPAVDVVRVARNEKVALRSLAPAGKPMLLWFWAPHCTFCRGEAPDLIAFEQEYGDRITVLGLGAQDDVDQARGFLADTGTEGLEMVWDASGKTWLHYKVTNQPTVLVVDAQGKVSRKWFRDFDADAILRAARLT
ncbi:TlpA family protein disulfide reductase [Sporichthya polymorpha]|uniref:TlpA family protein disulfide reductase n=1 Tax=Sporichthya polymorpha TaxID=35751 RepID=UPI000377A533|nr:TlpA disulfide reductase family protein [Sporichthya polymorpha]